MSKLIGFIVVCGLVLPARGAAQSSPSPGDRVRITRTNGTIVTGILGDATAEEVSLFAEGGEQVVARSEIGEMERSLGRHRRFGRNFGITMLSSSMGMGAIFALTWSPCTETGFLACFLVPTSRSEAFTWGLAGGALIGISVGVIVGLAVKHERWAPFTVQGPRDAKFVILPVIGTRFGVSASISLGGS